MGTRTDRGAIELLAWQLWQDRGRPEGDSERDWLEAERRLRSVDESAKDSFPASDPPASHLPDKPPANAEEKWENAGIKRSG